jgi:hypothetical protein
LIVDGISNVRAVKFGKQPPSDLSKFLRETADAVDRGDVVEFVCAYTQDDQFQFRYGASLKECLVLSALLHSQCIGRFKEPA